MADGTPIEWTDATWNIVTGCSVKSPGCTNCYAMRLAGTRLKNHPSRAGLTVDSKAGPVWTGEVRFNRQWLLQPLQWTRPRMIFVCAHGDLFHENVPDEWLDQVFAVMALAPQHTFQVLTKRPERMRAYLTQATGRIADTIIRLRRDRGDKCAVVPLPQVRPGAAWWPLSNVWLGASVENQPRAEERIPHLLATPAAVRWLSVEPLLGPVDLTAIPVPENPLLALNCLTGLASCGPAAFDYGSVDWVVVGGESGSGARPMHPDWARALRDECAAAGVPFHFKQWGAHAWAERLEGDPTTLTAYRAGKKAAGRLLDGIEHNGLPT
jgi:protein gp37